jgi:hypothetical protein
MNGDPLKPSWHVVATLVPLEGLYVICRLAADAAVPDWVVGPFVSVTRTKDELSVVCREEAVPEGVRCERGWRCLRVAGTLDLSLVGVMASISVPLADASVPAFVVSTFETDYVLVKEARLEAAVAALRRYGHDLQQAPG